MQFPGVKQDASQAQSLFRAGDCNGAKSGTWAQQNKKNRSIPPNVPVSVESGRGQRQGAGSGRERATDVAFKQIKPSGNFAQYAGSEFYHRLS